MPTNRVKQRGKGRLSKTALAILRIKATGVTKRHRKTKRYVTGDEGQPIETIIPGCSGCKNGLIMGPWPCEAITLAEAVLEVLPERSK